MKERLLPFLVLLEARYAPLLFAVAPQSYAVYLWLWRGSDQATASFWFAVMGALGYELVYVGAIAWAEEGRSTFWTWATAGVALIFSVVVAYYVYSAQGAWAWLHAGFPLVAFTYTLNMHTQRPISAATPRKSALVALPEHLVTMETPKVPNDAADVPALAASALFEADERQPIEALEPPSERLALAGPSAYHCPHCQAVLATKQARGAAAKNGYCPACKAERKVA